MSTLSYVRLAGRAIEYSRACAEIRNLTRQLGATDDRGAPDIQCATPVVDPHSQASSACRKWSWQEDGSDEDGSPRGGWYSARDREDWCRACVEVQRIHEARRAARKRRGHALTAIYNIARGLERNTPTAGDHR